VLTRALFTALLVMCAEGVIHCIRDYQDIRFMCGLSIYMPFTSSSLIVSNFFSLRYTVFGWVLFWRFYFGNVFYEIFEYRPYGVCLNAGSRDSSKASSPESVAYCFPFRFPKIFSFPLGYPIAAYAFFPVFPSLIVSRQ